MIEYAIPDGYVEIDNSGGANEIEKQYLNAFNEYYEQSGLSLCSFFIKEEYHDVMSMYESIFEYVIIFYDNKIVDMFLSEDDFNILKKEISKSFLPNTGYSDIFDVNFESLGHNVLKDEPSFFHIHK